MTTRVNEFVAFNERLEKLRDPAQRDQVRIESIIGDYETMIDYLESTERYAVHHGSKPHFGPVTALDFIRWHPMTQEVTRSYADGVFPQRVISKETLDKIFALLEEEKNPALKQTL